MKKSKLSTKRLHKLADKAAEFQDFESAEAFLAQAKETIIEKHNDLSRPMAALDRISYKTYKFRQLMQIHQDEETTL